MKTDFFILKELIDELPKKKQEIGYKLDAFEQIRQEYKDGVYQDFLDERDLNDSVQAMRKWLKIRLERIIEFMNECENDG